MPQSSIGPWPKPQVSSQRCSGFPKRMATRGTDAQMPPLATESVDQTGLDAVAAWIKGLR